MTRGGASVRRISPSKENPLPSGKVYEQLVAREILGYPEDRWCGYVLSFGYPADPEDLTRQPRAGGRKPLDEVIHRERW